MPIDLEMVAQPTRNAQASAVLAACEQYCASLESLPQLQALAGQTSLLVTVVFGGKRERSLWGIGGDAVGFHAIRSQGRGAGYGMVADNLDAHVCLDRMMADLEACRDILPAEERMDRTAQWMTTIAHEVLHALHWGVQSSGRSPAQVERTEGTHGLVRVTNDLVERLCPVADWSPHDGPRTADGMHARVELLVEESARQMTRACMPSAVAVLAGLDWCDIGASAAPARRPR